MICCSFHYAWGTFYLISWVPQRHFASFSVIWEYFTWKKCIGKWGWIFMNIGATQLFYFGTGTHRHWGDYLSTCKCLEWPRRYTSRYNCKEILKSCLTEGGKSTVSVGDTIPRAGVLDWAPNSSVSAPSYRYTAISCLMRLRPRLLDWMLELWAKTSLPATVSAGISWEK